VPNLCLKADVHDSVRPEADLLSTRQFHRSANASAAPRALRRNDSAAIRLPRPDPRVPTVTDPYHASAGSTSAAGAPFVPLGQGSDHLGADEVTMPISSVGDTDDAQPRRHPSGVTVVTIASLLKTDPRRSLCPGSRRVSAGHALTRSTSCTMRALASVVPPTVATELTCRLICSHARLETTRRCREIHFCQSHFFSSLSKCRRDHRAALVKHRRTPQTFQPMRNSLRSPD
jgi:hypothetical protein